MPGIKHTTKKHFAKASTSKKSIASGISAEFTDYRTKLVRVVTAIKSLIKQIENTPQVWAAVAKQQTSFADALLAALPTEGMVRSHAREVEGTVRQLQKMILDDDGVTAPHRKISSVLDAYLRLVESVQSDYPSVEMSYTEVVRYQKKVEKLQKKGEKKKTVLQRNLDKLTAARAEHEQKLAAVLERMKSCFEKHEAVFQCAHHAFWIAQEKYSQIINDATKSIRWESMAVRELLMKIDVHNSKRLLPIQRVEALMPPTTAMEISSTPLIEQPSPGSLPQSAIVVVPQSPSESLREQGQDSPSATVAAVRYVSSAAGEVLTGSTAGDTPGSMTRHAVVHLTPDRPTVSVTLPAKAADKDTERSTNTDETDVDNDTEKSTKTDEPDVSIPGAPNKTLQMPKPLPRQRSADVTVPTPTPVGA